MVDVARQKKILVVANYSRDVAVWCLIDLCSELGSGTFHLHRFLGWKDMADTIERYCSTRDLVQRTIFGRLLIHGF